MQTGSPEWLSQSIEKQRANLQEFFLKKASPAAFTLKYAALILTLVVIYFYSYSLYKQSTWSELSRHSNKIYLLYPVFVGLGLLFALINMITKIRSNTLMFLFYFGVLLTLSLDRQLEFNYAIFRPCPKFS